MRKHSRYLIDFNVAGMRYWDGALVLTAIKPGDTLKLVAEHGNSYDPDAVALYYKDKKIGYIPQEYNSLPAQLLRFGDTHVIECRVLKVDPTADPWKQIRAGIYMIDKS